MEGNPYWRRPPSRSVAAYSAQASCWTSLGGVLGMALLIGCTHVQRDTLPDTTPVLDEPNPGELVGDLTRPHGFHPVAVESVALVVGLNNTGSDPPPSPQRSLLLDEMRAREVENPNQVLASATTSLVLVRGFLPPACEAGDLMDIEVQVPSRSETTSLRQGHLMLTEMAPLAVLGNQIRSGHGMAWAQGPVLVDAATGKGGDKAEVRGRVLGGGKIKTARDLGLIVRSDHQFDLLSMRIAKAVNGRFYTFSRGEKTGAAEPKTNNFIRLSLQPRYKSNLERYLRVVQSIPIHQQPKERGDRLRELERELLDPATTRLAAIRLEALGADAVPVLRKGLQSAGKGVRFFSAEALAYLDSAEGIPVLTDTAQTESALRWHALTALSILDDLQAHDGLTALLSSPSAETRYGAFRALRSMNPNDPTLGGQLLGDQFHLHEIGLPGEPMIHISLRERAEIIVFGADQKLHAPFTLLAGRHITVKADGPDQTTLKRFAAGQPDEVQTCSTRITDVLRTAVAMGGTYPDLVGLLQDAKARQVLPARLVMDAVAKTVRTFDPEKSAPEGADTDRPEENGEDPREDSSSDLDATLPGDGQEDDRPSASDR